MSVLSLVRFKRCYKCGCTKPATKQFFYASRDCRYGVRNDCKPCASATTRKWVEENYEQVLQKARKQGHRYYRENRERLKANAQRYREENLEAKRETDRRYYAENKQKLLDYHRRYREENPEKCRERKQQWRKKNPELVRAQYRRRRAQKHSAEHEPYTEKELNSLWHEQGGCCVYCVVPLFGYYHVDHVIPLSRGGADRLENLVLACPSCNVRKGAMTGEEFIEKGATSSEETLRAIWRQEIRG